MLLSKYVCKCVQAADNSNINFMEFGSLLSRAENMLDECNDIEKKIEGLQDANKDELNANYLKILFI